MGIATDMGRLTQDIVSGHEDRAKALSEMREETRRLTRETQEFIAGLQASHQEMAEQLRTQLAEEKTALISEVIGMLNNYRYSRREEAAQLHKKLAMKRWRIKQEVDQHLGDAQRLVQGFRRSRMESGEQVRKELARFRTLVQSDVKDMLTNFDKAQAEVKAELGEAAAAWQELALFMREGFARAKPIEEKAPEVYEEKAKQPGQTRDLEAELLAAIEENLGGTTLAEAAKSLGVAPIALGRPSRILLDKGKIRKAAKLYFPQGAK
jgi:hypothetical protein